MTTVRNIIQAKGSNVWAIGPTASVFEALKLMAEKNVGVLLIREGEAVVGILSERDYARKIALKGLTSHKVLVKEIMTAKVISIAPEQSIDDCMAIMLEKHIRHLPVMENNLLRGIVSIGDVVKAIVAEREQTIEHLTNYITGNR
ncbi:MAG: CBS domain-containing protein [Bacteroidota bacterium]